MCGTTPNIRNFNHFTHILRYLKQIYRNECAEIMPVKPHMLQRNADAEARKIEMAEEALEEFEAVRAVEEFEAEERARKNVGREKEVAEYQRRTAINARRKEGGRRYGRYRRYIACKRAQTPQTVHETTQRAQKAKETSL